MDDTGTLSLSVLYYCTVVIYGRGLINMIRYYYAPHCDALLCTRETLIFIIMTAMIAQLHNGYDPSSLRHRYCVDNLEVRNTHSSPLHAGAERRKP